MRETPRDRTQTMATVLDCVADLKQREYKRDQMSKSVFAFYRATACLYYKDLEDGVIEIPAPWKVAASVRTWIQGDLHLQNFGFIENHKGRIVFDLNDFDEGVIAPFYLDLFRFCCSIYLAQDEYSGHWDEEELDEFCQVFLEFYQQTIEEKDFEELDLERVSGFLQKKMKKKAKKKQGDLLEKWANETENGWRFQGDNPKLEAISPERSAEILRNWTVYYKNTLIKQDKDKHFRVLDMARRLYSGLGSLGLEKYYVLIAGGDSASPLLLEIKQCGVPSAMVLSEEKWYFRQKDFANPGERVKTAARALLKNADDYLGVLENPPQYYLVRQISKYKTNFEAADFGEKEELDNFLKFAGQALASAHCRSDKSFDEQLVPSDFRKGFLQEVANWDGFNRQLLQLAKAYSQLVRRDYAEFLKS